MAVNTTASVVSFYDVFLSYRYTEWAPTEKTTSTINSKTKTRGTLSQCPRLLKCLCLLTLRTSALFSQLRVAPHDPYICSCDQTIRFFSSLRTLVGWCMSFRMHMFTSNLICNTPTVGNTSHFMRHSKRPKGRTTDT